MVGAKSCTPGYTMSITCRKFPGTSGSNENLQRSFITLLRKSRSCFRSVLVCRDKEQDHPPAIAVSFACKQVRGGYLASRPASPRPLLQSWIHFPQTMWLQYPVEGEPGFFRCEKGALSFLSAPLKAFTQTVEIRRQPSFFLCQDNRVTKDPWAESLMRAFPETTVWSDCWRKR